MKQEDYPNALVAAMTVYRRTFGHSVPSSEVKTATLMGTRDSLAGTILAYVGCGEANPAWARVLDPYEHEANQGGNDF